MQKYHSQESENLENLKQCDPVLILGGAGFLGSAIAREFVKNHHRVTVIDGFLPETGSHPSNLESIQNEIDLISKKIQDVPNVDDVFKKSSIVIDAMGWTLHLRGFVEPRYDLSLNVESHLHAIAHLGSQHRVLYLGSRGQYGRILSQSQIDESYPMNPTDLHGLHKLVGESYYKFYSHQNGFRAMSVRLPNCFGSGQYCNGSEIGLIADFIKKAIYKETILIYGENRTREIAYINDVASIVFKLAQREWKGFEPVNVGGQLISVKDLAEIIIRIAGGGQIDYRDLPENLECFETGGFSFDEKKLCSLIGYQQKVPIEEAVSQTVEYFKKRLCVIH